MKFQPFSLLFQETPRKPRMDVAWGFFSEKNRVKNLVKTFQCVMCATAYLPTHSLKSPAFLVPATLDDEGKNANFPSTPPHCRRRHRRRSSRRAGLSMSVAENLLDTEHTLNPSSHLGFLLSCLSVCLSVWCGKWSFREFHLYRFVCQLLWISAAKWIRGPTLHLPPSV